MKWRFQNMRLVLHRPVLLTTALRRSSWHTLTPDEQVAVGKCRMIAARTIDELGKECLPDLISGWNAVWFCYQACMVPLVSLFSDPTIPDEADKWKESLETALQFFETVRDWSIAAKRSGDAITRLYAAYKTHAATMLAQQQQQQAITTLGPQSSYQGHVHYHVPDASDAPTLLDIQQMFPQDPSAFQYNPATPTWVAGNDPTILNNIWDDMMWDTNLPDILDTPFGLSNEYEYTSAAHNAGVHGACWMHGN